MPCRCPAIQRARPAMIGPRTPSRSRARFPVAARSDRESRLDDVHASSASARAMRSFSGCVMLHPATARRRAASCRRSGRGSGLDWTCCHLRLDARGRAASLLVQPGMRARRSRPTSRSGARGPSSSARRTSAAGLVLRIQTRANDPSWIPSGSSSSPLRLLVDDRGPRVSRPTWRCGRCTCASWRGRLRAAGRR